MLNVSEAKLAYNCSFIDISKNMCKAAWSFINASSFNKKNEYLVSPNIFNDFCVCSVRHTKQNIVKPNITVSNLVENHCVPLVLFKWKQVTRLDVLNAVKR